MESLLSLGNGNRLRRDTFCVSSRWALWGRKRETNKPLMVKWLLFHLPPPLQAILERIHKVNCLHSLALLLHGKMWYSEVTAALTPDLEHHNLHTQRQSWYMHPSDLLSEQRQSNPKTPSILHQKLSAAGSNHRKQQ